MKRNKKNELRIDANIGRKKKKLKKQNTFTKFYIDELVIIDALIINRRIALCSDTQTISCFIAIF